MSSKWFSFRLSITMKLLAWCLVLIAVFYATTTLLLLQLDQVVTLSSDIVNVHYEVDVASKRLIALLFSLEENKKRYEILGKDEYRGDLLADLAEYRKILERLLAGPTGRQEPWPGLLAALNRAVAERDRDQFSIPESTTNEWLVILSRARQANLQEMNSRILDLDRQGREAARMGFLGLIASMAIGLLGTILIAYRLNRSLREVRRGIRGLTFDGRLQPVRVLSSDELGELAAAFNEMTVWLKKEEQMRADFISMLSHETRTPLTSIQEAVKLVMDGVFGELNERQHQFLEISHKEIQRLSSLLQRLMQASSLESHLLVLAPEPVEAGELVRIILERMGASAQAKGIEIQTTLPSKPTPVLADGQHVQQVLVNLLGNALKFSPTGSLVRISVSPDPEGRRQIFCVEDQGSGIPEDEQPHVFQKYYRGAMVRESVDGAGLGLSISKSIVEAHGGTMWLSSVPGQGSRFCFSLPSARDKV